MLDRRNLIIPFVRALLIAILSATVCHAIGGKVYKVRMDYHQCLGGCPVGGYQVPANSTLTVGDSEFTIYVYNTDDGTAPWTVKLTSPSGVTKQQSSTVPFFWVAWYPGDFGRDSASLAGLWTAQVDDGPTFSWTLAFPPAPPHITSVATSPNPPIAGRQFVLTVTGTGFQATNGIAVAGASCPTYCTIPSSALTTSTPTTLSGPLTVNAAGQYTVSVAGSNSLTFIVSDLQPSLTGITTSPSPPVAHQPFTITVNGMNFNPTTAEILLTGSNCTPCVAAAYAGNLTTATSTTLIGQFNLAVFGTYNVSVANSAGGTPSNSTSLNIRAGTPTIGGFIPPFPAVTGQPLDLVVNGGDFDPSLAQFVVSGPGCGPCIVSNNALTVRQPNQVAGTITLSSAGSFTLAVQNGTGTPLSNTVSFTVHTPAASINTISTSPTSVITGQQFTLNVYGTGFDTSTAQISILGPGCSPCILTNGSLTTRTPSTITAPWLAPSPGTFTVTVQNGLGALPSNGVNFVVHPAVPTLTAVSTSPSPVVVGQQFTLTATGSNFDPATVQILVSGPGCAPCTISNLSLYNPTVAAATGKLTLSSSGTFTVTVQNGSGGTASNGITFSVPPPAPTLSTVSTSPTPPIVGQPFALTVVGGNFDPSTAQILVSGPGCGPCTIANPALASRTATSLTGTLTLNSGAFTVSVQNGDNTASNALPLVVGVAPPAFTADGVLSAAGFRPTLARGSVTSLFGTALSGTTSSAQNTPLPRSLAGVTLHLCGVDAPIWFVSATQINFQIPFECPLSGSVTIVVTRNGIASQPVTVTLQPCALGVFVYERSPGVLDPIVTHVDGSLVTPDNPAAPGSYVVAWATGLGDLTSAPATGDVTPAFPLSESRLAPIVTVDASPVEVPFAGLTAGGIGLAQLNLHLPDTLVPNPKAELRIQFADASALSINLAIGPAH